MAGLLATIYDALRHSRSLSFPSSAIFVRTYHACNAFPTFCLFLLGIPDRVVDERTNILI